MGSIRGGDGSWIGSAIRGAKSHAYRSRYHVASLASRVATHTTVLRVKESRYTLTVSSGASSDIQYATRLARAMVTKWGMSVKLGPLQYEETQEGYLGYGGSARTMGSDETNKLIDAEIRDLVEGAHKRATVILKKNIKQLHLLAQTLLEHETLTGDEIKELVANGKIDREVKTGNAPPIAEVKGSAIPTAGRRTVGAAA